jgi:hypothetical protein
LREVQRRKEGRMEEMRGGRTDVLRQVQRRKEGRMEERRKN